MLLGQGSLESLNSLESCELVDVSVSGCHQISYLRSMELSGFEVEVWNIAITAIATKAKNIKRVVPDSRVIGS